MSVLSDSEIRALVEEIGLIQPFKEHALQGGSYDMALGQMMVISGVPRTLARADGGHDLEPGGFVLVTTHERLRLPQDLIGHNGIMSGWARRGLVSLFSPQIDPGFEGVLEVPIFNAGDAAVRLLPEDQIFTVEFVRMSMPASFLWVERWGPKNPPSYPLPPKAVRPNLIDVAELRADVLVLRDEVMSALGQVATTQTAAAANAGELRAQIGELRANLDALEKIVGGTTARKSLVVTRWNLWVAVIAALLAAATVVLTIVVVTK